MSKLIGKKVDYTELNYSDVDEAVSEFLSEQFGREIYYESAAVEEWSNDSRHRFNVEMEEPDDFDMECGELMSLGSILNWMCAKGKIDAGAYLVTVSW
jgi:hypothetical protein